MKRIKPEEVKEAYDETGLVPIRGQYAKYQGSRCGACALTVLAVHQCAADFDELAERDLSIAESKLAQLRRDLCRWLEIDEDYSVGFTNGFDGCGSGIGANEASQIGCTDGRAAAALVFAEAAQ